MTMMDFHQLLAAVTGSLLLGLLHPAADSGRSHLSAAQQPSANLLGRGRS